MTDVQQFIDATGSTMVDQTGAKIGRIEQIYLDDDTGRPEFALVNTGQFGTKSTFVPLAQASRQGGDVQVPFDKAQVKDAPKVDADEHLSQEEEADLYRYYGIDYSGAGSDSGLDVGTVDGRPATEGAYGDDTSGPESDQAMTRSEERLRVGTRQRETGRVRLRKHIVTEQVQVPVTLQREEARLVREPVTEANRDAAYAGPDLSEEEHEVVLREEVPVVDKNVVATERVRLDTVQERSEVQVDEQVRKEQIELDEDVDRR